MRQRPQACWDGYQQAKRREENTVRSPYNAAIRSAAYYESRAEEVRTIAEMTADPWCQKVLNGIVDD